MKRLFLGIAPNHVQNTQLSTLQTVLSSDGKSVSPTNFHMTLAFLGPLDIHDQYKLQHMLDLRHASLAQRWPQFSVTLDTLTLWRKPQVLCLSGNVQDPHLQLIIDDCRSLIGQIGIDKPIKQHTEQTKASVQQAKPFTPHISLFRKAKLLPVQPLSVSLTLTPKQVHLYASVSTLTGVEYQILQSWNLLNTKK